MDILLKVPDSEFPFDNHCEIPPIDCDTHREFLDEFQSTIAEVRYMYQKHNFKDFYIAIKSFIDANKANKLTEL